MKKYIRLFVCVLILLVVTTVIVSATNVSKQYTYIVNDTEFTVEFFDDMISNEKQSVIAERLVYGDDSDAQSYGLWCTLFGHELKESKVGVITHKVYTYTPRCKQEIYDVTICEKCDYQTQTLSSTVYIDCCPED